MYHVAVAIGYLANVSRVEVFDPEELVCVQVFTYNEECCVGRVLESVYSSYIYREFEDRFRVMVFDSGSDATGDIASSMGAEVYRVGRGKLRARNLSVSMFPMCGIHVHLDGDVWFPRNWLGNILSHFRDRGVVAATSPRIYDTPMLAIPMILWRGVLGFVDRLFGSNMAARHDALAKNPFNLEFDGREDMVVEEEINLYRRIAKMGRIAIEKTPVFTRPTTRKYIV